jgi:RimJ/RimL family protein N-acetyltransferase
VHTVKDAEDYIATKMLPQLQKLGFSNNTVIRKSDSKKIGSCGLYKRDGLDHVDIGFAFLPDYFNQGYAYEVSKKLVELAFSEFNITAINAITIKNNIASQKLIEKLRFKYLKIINIPNDDEDLMLYELRKVVI